MQPCRPRSQEVVQRIAGYLAARKHGFFSSACSTSPAVAHLIAEVVTYRWVPEGAPVFRQGGPGDSLYVLLAGYCSLTREEVAPAGAPPTPASAAPSRRATQERQQQERLKGLANAGSRRGNKEATTAAAAGASGTAALPPPVHILEVLPVTRQGPAAAGERPLCAHNEQQPFGSNELSDIITERSQDSNKPKHIWQISILSTWQYLEKLPPPLLTLTFKPTTALAGCRCPCMHQLLHQCTS